MSHLSPIIGSIFQKNRLILGFQKLEYYLILQNDMCNILKNIALVSVLLIANGLKANAEENDTVKMFVPMGSYTADLNVNMTGGIKTGARYVGYATLAVEINPWRNGRFTFGVGSAHCGHPSEELVGDIQYINNNDNDNLPIFLLYANYSHKIGNVEITAGIQDMTDVYGLCETSGNFMNLGFTTCAVIYNTKFPTSPYSSLGLNIEWTLSDALTWRGAVYNGGIIDDEDDNKYNLKHKLNKNKGYMTISEVEFSPIENGTFKLGGFYHTGLENWGIYGSIGAQCWQAGARHLDAFATAAFAPRKEEQTTASLALGATLTSLLSGEGKDCLGLGLSTAAPVGKTWETSIELNYRYQFNDYISLMPDLQWIINPAGAEGAKNALVGSLRLGFEF